MPPFCKGIWALHFRVHSCLRGRVCLQSPGQGVCGVVSYRRMSEAGRCGREETSGRHWPRTEDSVVMVITNSGPWEGLTPGTTKKWWWPECPRACAQKKGVSYKMSQPEGKCSHSELHAQRLHTWHPLPRGRNPVTKQIEETIKGKGLLVGPRANWNQLYQDSSMS